jgi:GH25 family lysozyme M1 (1,4-beta-N-acetylmuramidase)
MAQICPFCNGDLIGCPNCDNPAPRKKLSFKTKGLMKLASFMTAPAAIYPVQGIDISKWNGVMDFSITKKKCQYVIIRLGYGNEWKDARCDEYYQDLLAHDIPVAVYWYLQVGKDWRMAADHFFEQIVLHPPQVSIIWDAEETTLGIDGTLLWLQNFDGRLRYLINKIPETYTSKGFWDAKVARSNYFSERCLHVASWTLGNQPAMPLDFVKWGRWQWSADGNRKAKEYGMVRDGDFDMDLDRENLTVDEFNTKYGTHIKPIGDVPPMQLPEFFTPNGSPGYINIRSAPNPFGDAYIIGRATNAHKWKPIELVTGVDGKEWWRVNEYAYMAKWLTRY